MAKGRTYGTRQWSPDEIKTLKKEYPNKKTEDLAEEMGRSLDSLKAKASSMGMKKSKKYMKSIGRA